MNGGGFGLNGLRTDRPGDGRIELRQDRLTDSGAGSVIGNLGTPIPQPFGFFGRTVSMR